MKVAALLFVLFLLGLMLFFIGYANHDTNVMWLVVGWYLGVVLGCIVFYGMSPVVKK